MAGSIKSDTPQFSYVKVRKEARAETQLAWERQMTDSECDGLFYDEYKTRLIMPLEDAKKIFGAPILVFVDYAEKARLPSSKCADQFSRGARKAAHRKTQLAYELVDSDAFVDFYRARSILRLAEEDKEWRGPVFMFVDGQPQERRGATPAVNIEQGKVGPA